MTDLLNTRHGENPLLPLCVVTDAADIDPSIDPTSGYQPAHGHRH